MDTRLFYISTKSTYLQLRNLLRKSKLLSFALVDKQGTYLSMLGCLFVGVCVHHLINDLLCS